MQLISKSTTLGVNINTRREKHGNDSVPAKDLRFKGIMLTRLELDDLHGLGTWERFYVEGNETVTHKPFFDRTAQMRLSGKYPGSTVKITCGVHAKEIDIEDATVKRLVISGEEGGLTALDLTVSALAENWSGDLKYLEQFLDKDVTVAVMFGDESASDDDDDETDEDEDQGELPMDHSAAA